MFRTTAEMFPVAGTQNLIRQAPETDHCKKDQLFSSLVSLFLVPVMYRMLGRGD